MNTATPAITLLRLHGIEHQVRPYELSPGHGRERDERPDYGLEAAIALGVAPGLVFKTLVAVVDGHPAVALVPVHRQLDPKRFAAALGGRRAELADPAAAERAAGSVVGGISPLGMRRRLPTVLDASALAHPTVFVSAGRRGLQVELAPGDLVAMTKALVVAIAR